MSALTVFTTIFLSGVAGGIGGAFLIERSVCCTGKGSRRESTNQ